ncbi:MAG: Ig-like domain-containing protein [candidate division Zixibacteria bacterium]|nr:Ig-like domain-containing protein [candidate division Zixibacteria bacterium]
MNQTSCRLIFSAIIILTLGLGCAEIASPPGGPIDRTAPFLIGSSPETGAVDVEPGRIVTLNFSEPVVAPQGQNSVFISPWPEVEPKLKWKSDRLELIFAEDFAPDQTYVISVSSEIADLRRNRMDSSLIVAFSTGSTLDSGQVSGRIMREAKSESGMMVALYDYDAIDDSTEYDSIYPSYLTQTNHDGQFKLQYLPEQRYRLIAFRDLTKDSRFNPNREEYALPDREVIVGETAGLDGLNMSVTKSDTLVPSIFATSATTDGLVKIRLSKAVPLDVLRRSPGNLLLRSMTDTTIIHTATGFVETDLQLASTLTACIPGLTEEPYRAELTFRYNKPTVISDEFTLKTREDNDLPQISNFLPGEQPVFVSEVDLRLTFSEPIDTTKITGETFALWNDATGLDFTTIWNDAFRLKFQTDALEPGQSYRLTVTEFDIIDLAGNVMGDSLSEYQFATLDVDSLGSISGRINMQLPDKILDPIILTFNRSGHRQTYDLPVSGKEFEIDLPAGEYVIEGFIDSDMDGYRSLGSIYPFVLAETYATYPDTVSVRARFETSDIEFIFK